MVDENFERVVHARQIVVEIPQIRSPMKREQDLARSTGAIFHRGFLLLFLCGVLSATAWCQHSRQDLPTNDFERFGKDLDGIRNQLHIPGIAAAIVEDGRIVWGRDFGFANLNAKFPVTASTEFCIASLSKTMAAVILMQLREAGQLQLDEPMLKYLPDSGLSANITIREVMSHTSDGLPGEEFLYNGARYALLSNLIEKITGEPYASVILERIVRPLRMNSTIPGLNALGYEALQQKLAQPYQWDENSSTGVRAGDLPAPSLSAANGIVSTVNDLAKYAIALDGDKLVREESKVAMFTPVHSTRDEYLPYGLGWFVQIYLGRKLVWHFGQEDGYASLFVRIPDRKLTLIVLANSNAMSDAFRLLDGNAAHSLVALDFLKDVVLGHAPAKSRVRHQFEFDEDFDRSLASLYLDRHEEALSFTRAAFKTGIGQADSDVTMLYLLTHLHDSSFNPTTVTIGTELVRQHPNLPPALFYLGIFYEQTGQFERAVALFERVAEIQPPLRHWTTVLALLELGKWYKDRNPSRSREYLQRIIAIGWNLDGAVDQARQTLKELPSP
jgi:CubicO group peptidase (beta-lactamase class C family)